MTTKTVYQTNSDGLFLYETIANELALVPGTFNVPFRALDDAPPTAPAGKIQRHDGKRWTLVEDHRKATLHITATGDRYVIGTQVELEGEEPVSYRGWGPVPAWLTLMS